MAYIRFDKGLVYIADRSGSPPKTTPIYWGQINPNREGWGPVCCWEVIHTQAHRLHLHHDKPTPYTAATSHNSTGLLLRGPSSRGYRKCKSKALALRIPQQFLDVFKKHCRYCKNEGFKNTDAYPLLVFGLTDSAVFLFNCMFTKPCSMQTGHSLNCTSVQCREKGQKWVFNGGNGPPRIISRYLFHFSGTLRLINVTARAL